MPDSPSAWAVILTVAGSVGSSGILLGVVNLWVNRRRPQFDQLLIGAQAEKAQAETRSLKVGDEIALTRGAFELMDRLQAELRRMGDRCSELERENGHKDEQIKVLEAQLGLSGKGNGRGN